MAANVQHEEEMVAQEQANKTAQARQPKAPALPLTPNPFAPTPAFEALPKSGPVRTTPLPPIKIPKVQQYEAIPSFPDTQGTQYQLMYQRTANFTHPAWQAMPDLWAHLVSSNLPDQTVRGAAEDVPHVVQNLNDLTQFAGVPAALRSAYIGALNLKNPAARQHALQTLNSLQSRLNEGDQAVLMAALSNPSGITLESVAPASLTRGLGVATHPEGQLLRAVHETFGDSATIDQTGNIILKNEGAESSLIDKIVTFTTLFPQMAGKIQFSAGGMTLQDVGDSMGDAVQKTGWFSPLIGDKGDERHLSPLAFGETALNVFMGGQGEAINKAVGLVERPTKALANTGIGKVYAAPVNWVEHNIIGAPVRLGMRLMGDGFHIIGHAAVLPAEFGTATYNLAKGNGFVAHKFDQKTKDFVGNVVGIIALDKATEVAGQTGKTLAAPKEFTGAVENAGVPLEAGPGAALRAGIDSLKRGENLLHPTKVVLDPVLRATTWKLVSDIAKTGTKDWVLRGRATKVFSNIEGMKAKFGDTAPAAVQDAYPTLPAPLIERLVALPKEQMGAELVRYQEEIAQGGDIASRKTLVAQQSSLSARISRLSKAEQDSATASVEPPGTVNLAGKMVDKTGRSIGDIPANEVEWVKTQDIIDNARVLPRDIVPGGNYTPEETAAYKAAVARGDFVKPVEVLSDPATGAIEVTDGNHSVEAARLAGREYVPVRHITPANPNLPLQVRANMVDQYAGQSLSATYPDLFHGPLDTAGAIRSELEDIRAQKMIKDQQVADLAVRPINEPMIEFPGRRNLPNYMHRVLYRPTTPMEEMFRKILYSGQNLKGVIDDVASRFGHDGDWLGRTKEPTLIKLTDKLEHEGMFKWENPSAPLGERTKIAEDNRVYLGRLMLRFGVDDADALAIKQAFLDAKTQQDWFETYSQGLYGDHGVLAKYTPKNTPDVYREALLGIGGKDPLQFDHSMPVTDPVTGETHLEPIVPGEVRYGVPRPLPTAPSEMAQGFRLPSSQAIENVLSGAQRWAKNASEAGGAPKAAAWVYEMGKSSLHLSTQALKFPALAFNLPAIIGIKVMDEIEGNMATPGLGRQFRAGRELGLEYPIPPELTNSVVSGTFAPTGEAGGRFTPETSARDILSKGAEADGPVTNTLIERLDKIKDDPLLRAWAQTGLDETKMADIVNGGSEALTKHYNEAVVPQLQRAGMDQTTWIHRWAESLREATMKAHPDYLRYAADGHLGTQAVRVTGNIGEDLVQAHGRLTNDVANLRARLSEMDIHQTLSNDPVVSANATAEIRAHQAELKIKLEQMNEIERTVTERGGTLDGPQAIGATHKTALAKRIKADLDSNEIQLPDRMKIDITSQRFGGKQSLPDLADGLANKLSDYLFTKRGRLSFQSIGRAEAKGPRGGFYSQIAKQYDEGYRGLGLSPVDAKAMAEIRAASITKDLFYDLTARSTMERQVRNVFWFAPVSGELFYRWLYALPAQAGAWAPGVALLAGRAVAWNNFLKGSGLVHTDPKTGNEVLGVGGLGNFVKWASGGKLNPPDIQEIPIKSFFPHTLGGAPSVSPLISYSVNKMAPLNPLVQDFANIFAPYSDVSIVPYSIRMAMGAMGLKPWDISNSAVTQQYNQTHDLAYQYAFTDMEKAGDVAPSLAQFHLDPSQKDYALTDGNRDTYLKAWNPWFQRLNQAADNKARGIYAMRVVSSAFVPGSIIQSSAEKDAYDKFYKDNILPKIANTQGPMGTAVRQEMQTWLAQHPGSRAFAVTYNWYSGNEIPKGLEPTDPDYYKKLYQTKTKVPMSPEEYANVLAAQTSNQLFLTQLNTEVQAAAPDGSWATLLKNYGQRSRAVDNYRVEHENYLLTHPDAKNVIERGQNQFDRANGVPTQSIEAKYATDALTAMSALRGYLLGTDGTTLKEAKTVAGKLKALRASLYQSTGGTLTPIEQGVNAYFDNVVSPYFDKVNSLYDQIAKLQASGHDASPIYNQIAKIKAGYDNYSFQGVKAPSLDEFFYGTATPRDQKAMTLKWTAQPISWLSPWQREHVGYKTFQGEDKMWKQVQATRDEFYKFVSKYNVATGSKYYTSLVKWRDDTIQWYGNQYGKPGQDAVALETADPYVRLQTAGFGKGDHVLQNVFRMVNQAHQLLATAGDSPKGYSAYAKTLKYWVYDYIRSQQKSDDRFADDLETLSQSQLMTTSTGQIHPTGAFLYEPLFFGVSQNSLAFQHEFINSIKP